MTSHRAYGEAEPMLGMAAIAKLVQLITGYKPSRGTLWRWHLTGRLETRRIGGRLYATESAVRRMLAADEQRNRGSAGSRGTDAASRLSAALKANAGREATS
jgi:hypothetical protein